MLQRLERAALVLLVLGALIGADSRGNAIVIGAGTAGTANAGVMTVQGVSGGTTGASALSVQGSNADNATLAGSLFNVAGKALVDGSSPASNSSSAATILKTDVQGRLLVRNFHPNFTSAKADAVTATTQVLGASGASLSYYITDLVLSCGGTASVLSVVSSTTAGNACATSPATVIPSINMPISGNFAINFQTPIKVTANSALCCKTGGSTAFSCQVSGFIAP